MQTTIKEEVPMAPLIIPEEEAINDEFSLIPPMRQTAVESADPEVERQAREIA